jgi:hypothetical protein
MSIEGANLERPERSDDIMRPGTPDAPRRVVEVGPGYVPKQSLLLRLRDTTALDQGTAEYIAVDSHGGAGYKNIGRSPAGSGALWDDPDVHRLARGAVAIQDGINTYLDSTTPTVDELVVFNVYGENGTSEGRRPFKDALPKLLAKLAPGGRLVIGEYYSPLYAEDVLQIARQEEEMGTSGFTWTIAVGIRACMRSLARLGYSDGAIEDFARVAFDVAHEKGEPFIIEVRRTR